MTASKKEKSLVGILIAPFKYIVTGIITVINGFRKFISYIFKGIDFLLFKPFKRLNSIELTKSKGDNSSANMVKKDDSLKLEMNFNEQGEATTQTAGQKDIYSQMKENQKKANLKKKKVPQLSIKQKEKLNSDRENLIKMISTGQEERLEKPQIFRYKAMSPDGKVETSTFIGVSKLDIYTFLTGEGYTVFSIETSDMINFLYGQSSSFTRKLSTKTLIFFITQLCTYIKAGITLTEAVRILNRQLKKDKNQARITQSIVYYLTMGESFSNALAKQGKAFPQLVINMIRAAEAAGNLDETLEDLGSYYEEINTTQKQMISAMTYPTLVGLFAIAVIIFIMIKIVPQFVSIYDNAGAELNALTIFVINASNFLQQNIGVVLLFIGIAIVILIVSFKNIKEFRKQLQVFAMHIPVIGQIIIYNELTIFTKTFASLLKNDVFITDSIEILSKLTTNEVYKEIMLDTMSNITRGEKISESFKDHWAVPDIAYYMIVTGENTGQLAAMMAKVSAYYQEQHKTIINSLKSMIEPLLIVFLAVIVGGVLIAVVLPMFGLYESIS